MIKNDEGRAEAFYFFIVSVFGHGGIMKVTIKHIAAMAGVSRGTVDRALNDRQGINPDVQKRILRIADEMGYRPNPAAKALADNRYSTKKIGVLLNALGNPYFDEVIHGVKDALQTFEEFGVQSSIKLMQGYDVKRQEELLEELAEEGVNGIVMTPINVPEIVQKIDELKKKQIAVVTVNSDVLDSSRIAYVGCRYKKSGSVAAGILGMINRGNEEQYAVIGSSIKNLAVERRVQGIIETLEADYPWIRITDRLYNEDNDEISYSEVKKLLERRGDLDGICFAGAGSKGGIQAALESGKKLKIVTFDLTEAIGRYLKENVVTATVCQNPYRQGYDGTDLLGKYLLWNQKPVRELNYTELTIATKYSIT